MHTEPVAAAFIHPFEKGRVIARGDNYVITHATDAGQAESAQFLTRDDGFTQVLVGAQLLPLLRANGVGSTPQSVHDALRAANFTMHEPDRLHFFDAQELDNMPHAPNVRLLSASDEQAFTSFQQSIDPAELDEAFVELDHWLVMGIFNGDQLVAATSAYPWQETKLADIGVVTHPDHRRQGHGIQLVHAISHGIISRDYEPLYRAGVNNNPSAGVAIAAGMYCLGTWQLATPSKSQA